MIRDIQLLRGIAILAVVFAHVPAVFPSSPIITWPGWWTGVDIFLVVSGYVISRSLLPRLETAQRQWPVAVAFWIKRIYRLLPAAVLWATVALLLTATFNKSGTFGPVDGVLSEYVRSLLYVENFVSIHYVLGPYWSLSLEEQFYLVLPFAIILTPWLLRPPALLLLTVVLLLLMLRFEAALGYFRVAPLVAGVLIYQISRTTLYGRLEPTLLFRSPVRYLVIVALLTLLFASANQTWIPDRWFIVTGIPAALVLLASYDKGYVALPRGLGKVVEWVGNRSYSVYLIHMPILMLTFELCERMHVSNTWLEGSIAVLLTMFLASISYRFVEQTGQRMGQARADEYLSRHRTGGRRRVFGAVRAQSIPGNRRAADLPHGEPTGNE